MDWWNAASGGQLIGLSLAWAAWFVLLFGGFAFGNRSEDGTRRMPRWTRMGASLALVLAAWIWALVAHGSTVGATGWVVALGMTWGWIGDLSMAQLLPIRERVLGGIAAFGIGHIFYILGFLILTPSKAQLELQILSWVIWLLIGTGGWYLIVWRGSQRKTVHKVALPYTLLLASTTGIATGLALSLPGLWPLAVGAALFLFSDLLLATQLFNNAHFPLISDVVWLLYSPGQMLIVYGMANVIMNMKQGSLL